MKFAIVGAGAVGGFLGAKLALSGNSVTLIARGSHLKAIQDKGLRVHSPEGDLEVRPSATDDFETVGPVDYIFLTVKAHGLPEVAPKLAPLLGPSTAVLPAQNGVPWWYFQRHGGPWDGVRLDSLDPEGALSDAIPTERIIGCVVYPSTVVVEPGVIEHIEGDRFAIGELDGSTTDRCRQLSAALIEARLRGPIRSRIRHDLWVKLLGNLAFNPISALTGATLGEITAHPEADALAREVMAEADAVAQGLGVKIPISIDQRMAGAEKVGGHKTSMLQDVELGRPLELESIVGAVLELGEMQGIPMPHTKTLYACTKLLVSGTGLP